MKKKKFWWWGESDPYYVVLSRLVLGIIFLVSGFNNFFHLMPATFMPTDAMNYLGGFDQSPFLTFLKVTEIAVGVLFVSNLFVPLALIILAPIVINIMVYSVWLNPANIAILFLILAPMVTLFYFYRKVFYVFLKPQLYSHAMAEKTSNIIIVEEVEEKLPERKRVIRSILEELKAF